MDEMIDCDAMFRHVSASTPIDLIAEAWRVLADFDLDPTGKSGRTDLGYFDEDWCKMARRTIRGFAEANKRPWTWPWPEAQFDQFPWRNVVKVDAVVQEASGQMMIGGTA